MTNYLLLCSDLDRTLLPNGPQAESADVRERFASIVSRPEVPLAYVSGRHRGLVVQAMINYRLPRPDFVIDDVGTTIYEITATDWRPWDEWVGEITPDRAGLSHTDAFCIVRGGLPGMNGNHCVGVPEGLSHFMPQAVARLEPEEVMQYE